MSLTTGRGPLGSRPAGHFSGPVPTGISYVEPFGRRVRGLVGDHVVIDSEAVLLVHRPDQPPTFAFPRGDVADVATEPEPLTPGHVRVAWDALDTWMEEDQVMGGRPRNPYHRVDIVPTSRLLVVEALGVTLVRTTRTTGLYETSLAPRLYVAPSEVRTDLLVRSDTTTWCGYKGVASYWTLEVDDRRIADVAWSYDDPLPESLPIGGMLCFDDTRVSVTTDLPTTPDAAP